MKRPATEGKAAGAGNLTTPSAAAVAPAAARSEMLPSPPRAGAWAAMGRSARVFCGRGGDASYLWPRWLVLRAVGIVYVCVFWGIIQEGAALLGPRGLVPLEKYLAAVEKISGGGWAAFLAAPSVFWINTGSGMIAVVAWGGLLAALALVFNFWPRISLLFCWAGFLSCVSTWGEFSPAQLDRLMLEVAMLCVPFAPPGMRPGLGARSPPRPIAVFMMRWLLFRVMFVSGMVKIISPDVHWRNFTAMDVMYETSPSPTILGYWVHQLPHAYHVFEIGFTFAAEVLAPLLAVLGGRRGRWVAFFLWVMLQAGIQLTCNFGWLNTAAAGLGLLLLDDQMLKTAVGKFRWEKIRGLFPAPSGGPAVPPGPGWQTRAWQAALGVHFALTLFYFAKAFGIPVETGLPGFVRSTVNVFNEFRSANGYTLYASFDPAHCQVDFEGSNDAGKTWRTYEFRTVPQQVDAMPPFVAPRFARFDTAMEIQSSRVGDKTSVMPLIAAHLLAGNPEIVGLFARDPFPDRQPTVVRMRRYALWFTDAETLRRTGHYWRKEDLGDYLPAMHVTPEGAIEAFSLEAADAALGAGSYAAALQAYETQYQLGDLDAGYRLADMYSRGLGVREQPQKVFELFAELARRGEVKGLHNTGVCYEFGVGVPVDFAKAGDAYRRAAERGNLASFYALGMLAVNDRLTPKNDVQGLAWLIKARARATGEEPFEVFVRGDEPAQAQRLMARMSPGDIAKARAAAERR